MNIFSISQLSGLSGIKAHTIRMWEQRYNALEPTRSEGNVRTYSDSDLRRLLNIVTLLDGSHKVSELCTMPNSDLYKLIEQRYISDQKPKAGQFVTELISAGMDFDENSFQRIISHCLLQYGVRDTYVEVIYPLLVRLGLMWSCDIVPPAHEHFICNLLRQKLFSAIDGLPGPLKIGQRWLLLLPENEHHEMGLLFAQFLLRQARQTVFYLGTGVPRNSLPVAIEKTRPDKILMSFVRNNEPETAGSYLDEVSAYAGDAKVFVSGNENLLSQLSFSGNQMWLKNVEDLEKVISETMVKLPENMN